MNLETEVAPSRCTELEAGLREVLGHLANEWLERYFLNLPVGGTY